VRQDAGGSLPIVVTGLGRLEGSEVAVLLEGLSQLTDDVQVVVLCDSEAATGWARDAGLDRALASQPGLVRG
jgi:hypothetical protein